MTKKRWSLVLAGLLLISGSLLSACAPSVPVNRMKLQETVTVHESFQGKLKALPTATPYMCGAWSSSYGPAPFGTITIYAKLTRNLVGVPGVVAQARVNFTYGTQALFEKPLSDKGGYVTFTLPLQGRQPRLEAATVDVSFLLDGKTITCSQAFFTPQ